LKAASFVGIFALTILSTFSLAYGHATYTGYSGAPGCRGTCATSCHGATGGAIQISGFPNQYVPGQAYTITISHGGSTSIRQFNGSCRIGSGSQNAGVIAAGTGTSTYNATGETNGIHFTATNQNTGTFQWTAPANGTGIVKLYVAGQQGNSGGQCTALVLTSTEQATGIESDVANPKSYFLLSNYPNPFNSSTTIRLSMAESGSVKLNIYNSLGVKIQSLFSGNLDTGEHLISWNASRFPSGIYFVKAETNGHSENIKIVLLK
jgi:hypothetical protein